MKNNTKIRLHLSKQLFESLTKQVIAEAKMKNLGAGMTEIKAKKAPKKEKMEEMETRVAEKENMQQLKELDSTNASLYDIGVWASDLLNLGLKDENDLVGLGGKVLSAGTAGAFGVATGLIMYSDQIKAGIKKAGALLKNLAKGGGAVKEDTGTDPLKRLPADALAALKK